MDSILDIGAPMSAAFLERCLARLRQRYPFLYCRELSRTRCGRPLCAVQLGGGAVKVMITAAHHANESITALLLLRFLEQFCRAVCRDERLDGISARKLFQTSMLYCVPLANPDGAELVSGALAESSPEYRAAKEIAGQFPGIAFPDGWKANLSGVDLNLNFPADWELAKKIKAAQGFDRPAPRDYPGKAPLDQPETAALCAWCGCIRPDRLVCLHTQGEVIYPANEPVPGSAVLAERMQSVSGYAVQTAPPQSANAGFKDWFCARFRRPGFTVEAGLGTNPLPLSDLSSIYPAVRAILLQTLRP